MIEIHRTALVLAPAATLYDLINDIESYPAFLDGVAGAKVLEFSETEMLGQLIIQKAGIERTLVTRNRLVRPSSIEMMLEEGPLEYLRGHWQITALSEDGCRVSLDLSFSGQRGIKAFAFNALFKQIADSMVSSFVERAIALHK